MEKMNYLVKPIGCAITVHHGKLPPSARRLLTDFTGRSFETFCHDISFVPTSITINYHGPNSMYAKKERKTSLEA